MMQEKLLEHKFLLLQIMLNVVAMCFHPAVFMAVSFLNFIVFPKHLKLNLSLLVLSHAIVAYYWIPWNSSFDLTRFHQQVLDINQMTSNEILKNLFTLNAPIMFLIKYLVSLTGNVNLLQSFVTGITLILLFIQLYYFIEKYQLPTKNAYLLIIVVYAILPLLRLISGLWSIFAIVYMSLIFLLYYEGKIKNDGVFYFLLYISSWIHLGSLIPVFLFLIYKLFKINNVKRLVLAIGLIIIFMTLIPYISSTMYQLTNITVFNVITSRYNAYVFNQGSFEYLNNIRFILVEISKSALVLYVLYNVKNDDELYSKELYLYLLFLTLFVSTVGLFIRILLRFTLLSGLLAIPYMSKLLLNLRKQTMMFKLFLLGFLVLNLSYLVYALYNANIFSL